MARQVERIGRGSARHPVEPLTLRYHRLGRALLRAGDVSGGEYQRLAGELGLRATLDSRYKSLRLVKVFAGRSGLAELERLCRIASPTGRRIGWSHIIELMVVPKPGERSKLTRRAVAEGLDSRMLRQLIRQHLHRGSLRPRSGRPRRPPINAEHAAARLEQELAAVRSLICWLEKLSSSPRRNQLPHLLRKTNRRLDALEETLLGVFKQIRRRRPSNQV